MAAIDSNQEAGRLWEQVRREKAAGGYPWTHLSHNEQEEVWIDPLSLPDDISRETTRRRDGTIPPEWFHLPQGATVPTVEELLKEDSPEVEDEGEALQEVGDGEQQVPSGGRKTPSGRRTPLCGRHRHRNKSGKSSGGSSPAPYNRCELPPVSQVPALPLPAQDDGGYEPVGVQPETRPETRSPQSQLPAPPSGDETDTTHSCFPLRLPRSRSKEKRLKKNSAGAAGGQERRQSRDSSCSDHNYETPKLLKKSPKISGNSPPRVNRKTKPDSGKRTQNDQEDGYEPVGKAPLNMETWIAEKNNEFNAILASDADTRNVSRKIKEKTTLTQVPKIEVDKIFPSNDEELEDVQLVHLQRNLSDKSIKSDSSGKSSAKEKKKLKAEEEQLLKEKQKKEKVAEKEEKKRQKEENKTAEKARLEKEKENKRLKEDQKEQKRKDDVEKKRLQKHHNDELKHKYSEEKKAKLEEEKNKKIQKDRETQQLKEEELLNKKEIQRQQDIEKKSMIDRENQQRLLKQKEEKELRLQQDENRKKEKEKKEEEKNKTKVLEEEKKKIKEEQRQEEKERKALARLEKEMQTQELRALTEAEQADKSTPELEYADEEFATPAASGNKGDETIILAEPVEEAAEEDTLDGEGKKDPAGVAGPPEMALSNKNGLDDKYVSVVTNDDFANFQTNGNGHREEDEEIDFTPQNGYEEPEDMEYEEVGQGRKVIANKPIKKNKADLMGKIAAAGTAMKKARLPTPGELKEGYLNSAFHKSLHQPLIVKAKVEKEEVRVARQALTIEKSPTQLGNIDSVSDIPIPKVFSNKEGGEAEEPSAPTPMPKNMDEWGTAAFNTLPKSFREQNIVTAVKENLDPEELARNQELTKTKSPAELAQIHSLAEFPVPDNIKKFLTLEKKTETPKKEPKKRRHSVSEAEGPPEPFSLYSTLPRSMRETKLVTNVKVEEDEEVLRARQELVRCRTPAQLSAICSLGDLPVPSKLTRMMPSRDNSAHTAAGQEKKVSSRTPSKMNVNDMYSTLPKSLTMELAVKTKINDPAVVEERRRLTAEHSPMELGNIGSLADLPIPQPISNLFQKTPSSDTPVKPQRSPRSIEEKRKRNLTTGTFLSADFLPASWTDTKLVCRTKVEGDLEVLRTHQEVVAGKSVAELSQIQGLEDFPLPTRIETLVRKKRVLKTTGEKEGVRTGGGSRSSVTSLSTRSLTSLSMPESLRLPLAVKAVVEDQDLVARNKETIKTKSVGELAHIGTLADLPIPDNIENLYKKLTATSATTTTERRVETPSERPTSPQSFKETIYETLPRSLRETQLVCNSKYEEDEDRLKERQELTRTKSPTELSQISSMSDFPIPTPIENLLNKKSEHTDSTSPVPPPRKYQKDDDSHSTIYDSLPASLTCELLVRSREADQEEVAVRRETIRTHTPAQLSQIHGLADLPIPTFIENLVTKNGTESTEKATKAPVKEEEKGPFKIYDSLPAALTDTKLVVKSLVEEPEVQAARAEVVKSKSVSELSQVTSITDFPIPEPIENFVKTLDKKHYAPAERRKKIKELNEQTKSKSTQSLSQGIYASLPRSLKQELAVKTVEQEQDLVVGRRELLASKSVSELSKVTSLADFPVPKAIQKVFHKSMEALGGKNQNTESQGAARPVTPSNLSLQGNIYATLPKSLKAELLVSSVVEDPLLAAERMQLTSSKSVSELSQIRSLAEFPLPENIERLMSRAATNTGEQADRCGEEASPLAMPRNRKELQEVIYRGLPAGLTQPCVVRSKVEDPTVLLERQQLQQTKSIHELSKIRNLNELPIPGNVIKMPDMPLPKMRSILNVIAKPPQRSSPRRTPKSETYRSFEPDCETEESTPMVEERQVHSPDCPSEDRYEEISTRTEDMEESLPSPPPPEEEEEEDQFSLADQIRATPERSLKKDHKKKNRRSTDSDVLSQGSSSVMSGRLEDEELPPPLPPKRNITPSPKKGGLEAQSSMEEEVEAVPVKGILSLQAIDGNIRVVRNEIQPSQGDQPQAPPRERQSQPREMTDKAADPVQSRPLPPPPAPPRTLKKGRSVDSEGRSSRASAGSPSCYRDAAEASYTETENFRTCKDTLPTSKTLVDSANRPHSALSSDVTLADSCVDSLQSCAETLVGDSDPNLETCAETLRDEDQTEFFSDDDLDNPYPAVDFDQMMVQGPGAGATIVDRPGRSNVKKSESGRRLEEGTQQLSLELMEHVESLKTTLDNMSSRLGTRSRSRSHSKSRTNSQYRPSEQQ